MIERIEIYIEMFFGFVNRHWLAIVIAILVSCYLVSRLLILLGD